MSWIGRCFGAFILFFGVSVVNSFAVVNWYVAAPNMQVSRGGETEVLGGLVLVAYPSGGTLEPSSIHVDNSVPLTSAKFDYVVATSIDGIKKTMTYNNGVVLTVTGQYLSAADFSLVLEGSRVTLTTTSSVSVALGDSIRVEGVRGDVSSLAIGSQIQGILSSQPGDANTFTMPNVTLGTVMEVLNFSLTTPGQITFCNEISTVSPSINLSEGFAGAFVQNLYDSAPPPTARPAYGANANIQFHFSTGGLPTGVNLVWPAAVANPLTVATLAKVSQSPDGSEVVYEYRTSDQSTCDMYLESFNITPEIFVVEASGIGMAFISVDVWPASDSNQIPRYRHVVYSENSTPFLSLSGCPVGDKIPPRLVIEAPYDGQVFSGYEIKIEGSATDDMAGNSGISEVLVNGQTASGGSANGSEVAHWSQTLLLNPGQNVITVTAKDNASPNNQSTQVLSIYFQPLKSGSDMNGDGQADILWRDNWSGATTAWLMNGTMLEAKVMLPFKPAAWKLAGSGDFNRDGHNDLVWANEKTGRNLISFLSNNRILSEEWLPNSPGWNWQLETVADYDRDGSPDLLWQNQFTGELCVWLMNGTSLNDPLTLPRLENRSLLLVGIGDFNGDGYSDLLWHNSAWGSNVVWLMQMSNVIAKRLLPAEPLQGWDPVGTADFNGDGRPDILWRNKFTGQNAIRLMEGMNQMNLVPLPRQFFSNWYCAVNP